MGKEIKKRKMKTVKDQILKMSSVCAFVLMSSFSTASNLTTGNDGIIGTEKTIKRHMSFPNVIWKKNSSEKVEVVFTTNEKGKVNFVIAKTANQNLKNEIEKEFSELTLLEIKSNVAYSIVFNIKMK